MSSSLIPTFEQVPYNGLVARVDSGSQGLFELTHLLLERKELEEKAVLYSAKVGRSNLYEHEIGNSSSERVLGFFKNYHLFLSKSQVKLMKGFSETIIKDLEEQKLSRASTLNKHKVSVQNCLRDVTQAEEALEKAKKNYLKAKMDYERGKEKLTIADQAVLDAQKLSRKELQSKDANRFSVGRVLSAFENTPEQERDKQQKKVERRRSELITCLGQIGEKKTALLEKIAGMDYALARATTAFQEAEAERISKLKSCMKTFCELERAAITARSELLSSLEGAVNSHNPEEDILLYIHQAKQVELTHKYTNALELMDLHFKQK